MGGLKLEGGWTAIVTPFTADGKVNWGELEKNIEFQIAQGITGIVPVGTTGESPTLAWEEHEEVIERAIKLVNRRIKVIAGTGSNSTDEALAGSVHARDLGADGVLLVDCYYNGPSSLELREFYHRVIAEAVPEIAVVPYIIPGRTGCALASEDLAILASMCPNVRAVKEATGDLDRMRYERSLLPPPFSILSGDDDLTYTMMTDTAIQASGVISVVSNVVPAAVEKYARVLLAGNRAEADRLRDALSPLFSVVTVKVENTRRMSNGVNKVVVDRFRNPLAIKTLMAGLGMGAGPCRAPLGRMTWNGVEIVRAAIRKVWTSAPELLEPINRHYGVDVAARIEDNDIWRPLALRDPAFDS